jgi:SAM-dependent methyltransferase
VSEITRRWIFVQREITKNLAMGAGVIRAIRGSRTRRAHSEEAVRAEAEMCDFYLQQVKRRGLPETFLQGKRALEIGPGASLIIPLWFLAEGARHAEGIDRFMDLLPASELAALHSVAIAAWPPEMRSRVEDLAGWLAPGKKDDRLRYRHRPIETPGDDLAGSFDLAVSFNTLEHVADAQATMRSLYRLLAPGGSMIHRIHCGTHGIAASFGARYLNQLTFSPRLWRLMNSNRGGTNQQPMGAFVKECELAGFKSIEVEILDRISDDEAERLRPRLHPSFRSRQGLDLSVLAFVLTAAKP